MTVDYVAYQAAIDRALMVAVALPEDASEDDHRRAREYVESMSARMVAEVRCDRCARKIAEILTVPALDAPLWVASVPDAETETTLRDAAKRAGRVNDPDGRRLRGWSMACRVLLDGAPVLDDRLRCLAHCPKHGTAEVEHAVARRLAAAGMAVRSGKVPVHPVRCVNVVGTT